MEYRKDLETLNDSSYMMTWTEDYSSEQAVNELIDGTKQSGSFPEYLVMSPDTWKGLVKEVSGIFGLATAEDIIDTCDSYLGFEVYTDSNIKDRLVYAKVDLSTYYTEDKDFIDGKK